MNQKLQNIHDFIQLTCCILRIGALLTLIPIAWAGIASSAFLGVGHSTYYSTPTAVKQHPETRGAERIALNLHFPTRRDILKTTIAPTLFFPSVGNTVSLVESSSSSSSSDLPTVGLLESRVLENVLSPPPYQLESSDIYYPDYFDGVWQVVSTTKEIQAPCGILLFGGNNTYTRAQREVNTVLSYKARFIPTTTPTPAIIADREYNVVEIAKAAMGETSVLDVPLSTPNKVSVILAPNGANQILKADLITIARRSETLNDCEFHCSEVVRQVVGPANPTKTTKDGGASNIITSAPTKSTLLKEIETVNLYTAIKDMEGNVNEIHCLQKSATFLLPSQQDPMAYKMWEATRGRPIDVRFYDIVYTRKRV